MSSKARLDKAAELFEDFTGHEPGNVTKLNIKPIKTALLIGECDGILYTTKRDGVIERYIHKFKKQSRPLLATNFDGSQLIILGGEYRFTNRGIVDRN